MEKGKALFFPYRERKSIPAETLLSVIQRQQWLLENNLEMTEREAYDAARKEFYRLRLQEDIKRRIAAEEAMAVGARFGKSYIEVGLEVEGKVLADWRTKAAVDLALRKHRRNAAYTSTSAEEDEAIAATAAAAVAAPTEEAGDPVAAAAA